LNCRVILVQLDSLVSLVPLESPVREEIGETLVRMDYPVLR